MPDLPARTDSAIGAPLPRVEDARLLTGAGRFVDDIDHPGCLHLAIVRSQHARAALRRVDGAAARALPGVRAVITAADLGSHGAPAINPLVPDLVAPPFALLADGAVHAVGQPVAAVIAVSAAAALDAAEAVVVEADAEPAVLHGAGRLLDAGPDGAAFAQAWTVGDVEAAERSAAAVVAVRLEQARLAPSPLEPRSALAVWDDGRLTVWLGTQAPHRARADIAAVLGLDPALVRVIAPDVGGAFGARASIHPEELLVAWAAWRLSAAVRWRGSRQDDLVAGTHGRGAALAASGAFAADGRLLGLRARLAFPLGHRLPYSAAVPARNAARILPGPYRVGAADVRMWAAADDTAAMGIYRGAGRPEAALLMERLMDRAAARLGLDPLEIRRRNAASGAHRTAAGDLMDSADFPGLLAASAERAGYAGLRAAQAERRRAGELVGVGIALYAEPCGEGWESARLRLLPDGRIEAATGSTAQGQGRETAAAQIVAGALEIGPERVVVRHGDTDATPAGIGALASRSTPIGGSALLRAAKQLRERARAYGDPPDWVMLAADPDIRAGLEVELVHEATRAAWGSGCCIAVARVDRDTGVPTVERIVWVDDPGRVVNPRLVEGQLLGGLAQGLGEALMERVVHDGAGQLLTGSLMDYALPRASDMPPVELAARPLPSAANPLGAKGVGEAGAIAVPPAVLGAVLDALAPLGVEHLDLPLTSETIWQAMRSANREEGR